jgi:hypothetical protein
MYKHARANPGLLKGGTRRIDPNKVWNSPKSKQESELAITLGIDDQFSKKIFHKNRAIFERHRGGGQVADALNRAGVRMLNRAKWSELEVSVLLKRVGNAPKRGRRILD